MTGRPQQQLNLPRRTVTHSGNYSEDISGGYVKRLQVTVGGTVTNGSSPTMNASGPIAALGDLRLTQNSTPLFSVPGRELFAIARHFNGFVDSSLPSTASQAVNVRAVLDLDFDQILPGAGFDATQRNRFGIRFDTRPATAFGSTSTAASLDINPAVEHYGGVVGNRAVMVPRWITDTIDASSASTAKTHTRTFAQAGVLIGVAISAIEKGATEAADVRSDAMISRLKMKLVPSAGTGIEELCDDTWSRYRQLTNKSFRVPEAQTMPGFMLYRFMDPRATAANAGLTLDPNDSIELNIDNASPIEASYGSLYTPASGDQFFVTWLFFEPALAGSAARAQQGRAVSARPQLVARGRR